MVFDCFESTLSKTAISQKSTLDSTYPNTGIKFVNCEIMLRIQGERIAKNGNVTCTTIVLVAFSMTPFFNVSHWQSLTCLIKTTF